MWFLGLTGIRLTECDVSIDVCGKPEQGTQAWPASLRQMKQISAHHQV